MTQSLTSAVQSYRDAILRFNRALDVLTVHRVQGEDLGREFAEADRAVGAAKTALLEAASAGLEPLV